MDMKPYACQIVNALKEIIDRNGKDYLYREPYKVFTELTETDTAKANVAGAIFCILVCGIIHKEMELTDIDSLSRKIQDTCFLNNAMADDLAEIICELYSDENEKQWMSKDREGLNQFLHEDFVCKWNGLAVWQYGSGTVTCHYDSEIILDPTDNISEDEELSRMLEENPFLPKETIRDYYEKKLKDYLNWEFETYCTCDDYYQPVVEDFEIDSCVKEWCKKNGFEYQSSTGEGYDDGYEPDYRRW